MDDKHNYECNDCIHFFDKDDSEKKINYYCRFFNKPMGCLKICTVFFEATKKARELWTLAHSSDITFDKNGKIIDYTYKD